MQFAIRFRTVCSTRLQSNKNFKHNGIGAMAEMADLLKRLSFFYRFPFRYKIRLKHMTFNVFTGNFVLYIQAIQQVVDV